MGVKTVLYVFLACAAVSGTVAYMVISWRVANGR